MADSAGWSLTESGKLLPPSPAAAQRSSHMRSLCSLTDRPRSRRTDPGVFTGILHELGVRGVQVEELWGLDADLLKELEYVHLRNLDRAAAS